jgi:energy coupling factor transporter S component ThiW
MNTNKNQKLLKLIYLAMMVALGVVISPILRIEGMCPMQHLINVTCAVMIGPWGALVCAILIGVLRMVLMGITPMALTGAVFGAFLSGMLYRLSHGKLIFAVLGEVIGTGVIGAIVSYPVMTYLWGRTGLTWFFYVPSFTAGTIIGGSLAFLLLRQLQRNKMLPQIQAALGSNIYTGHDAVVNDSLAIALAGFIFYLVTVVIVKNFVAEPTGIVAYLKYIVLLAFFAAAAIFWFAKKEQR